MWELSSPGHCFANGIHALYERLGAESNRRGNDGGRILKKAAELLGRYQFRGSKDLSKVDMMNSTPWKDVFSKTIRDVPPKRWVKRVNWEDIYIDPGFY
ncbi:hypothetical protein YTPLAS18_18520 [Nitrospira sp.]|nr:hypothetical protein YTPLAS18_18520 [Nitrospira sp.]